MTHSIVSIDECGAAPGQVGAIFAIRGTLVGMEVFDCPGDWRKLGPKLLRSCALDALDGAIGGNGFGQPAPGLFVEAVASLPTEPFPAVGLGDDHRIDAVVVVGGALVADERVIHVENAKRKLEAAQRRAAKPAVTPEPTSDSAL